MNLKYYCKCTSGLLNRAFRIITILGSYKALYITPKGVSKRLVLFPAKYVELQFWSMRPFPLYHNVMVYKVQWCNMQPIKLETLGQTPSLFDKCTGFFNVRYTMHRTRGFTSHPKDQASWFSVLLKDPSVTTGDSNPHSSDQKHQSLNLVLLTARPWHFHILCA